jgi:hypothetical protein
MRKILLTTGFIIFSISLMAQEIAVTVDAPTTAVAGQGFRIVYSVNSTDGRFQPPVFDPSFTVSGPQTSTSRNVQWINGEVTSVSTTTLIYYIVARETGKYIIPPAQYTTKKLTVASSQVEMEVFSDGSAAGSVPGAGQQAAASGRDQQVPSAGAEVSLRMILSDNVVYVGQPVTVTIKLYTRINLSGINDLRYPDFKGFLREDIETPPLKSLQQEVIGGTEYGTGVLQRFMLFPQVPGEIKIDPVQITAMVQQRAQGGDPFFDSFFSNVTTVPRTVSSEVSTIKVKPLPSPVPSDFYGAVGSFDISSSLSKTEIEVNDALTYTVTLKGSGNLSLAGTPVITFPQGIEKYDPKINIKGGGAGSGSKIFEYLLIPRSKGAFELPPLSYTVFDLKEGKYVTLRTEGYKINVTGGSGTVEANAEPAFVPGEDVKYLGQDIRFIRSDDLNLYKASRPLVESTSYWLWYLYAFLAAAAVLVLRRENIRRNADLSGVRNRKAAKVARKRLTKASAYLTGDKPEMVHEELARALWGYLGDKLSIPLAELTREYCYSELRSKSIDEPVVTEIDSILTACEYSRYSPSGESESPAGLYKRTVDLIRQLENLLS